MKNKFVFSFTNAGLFSEINNFLLALLYAHKNNFEVIIDYNSLKSIDEITLNTILNLKTFNKGCSTVVSKASTRSLNTYLYAYSGYSRFIRLTMFLFYNARYQLYSLINNSDIDLLQKHWNGIRELRLNLSEEDNFFLFNTTKSLWIHATKGNDKSNSNFIGAHIRRGDKITETKFILLETYFDEIKKQCKINDTKDVFLFTDLMEEGVKLKVQLMGYNVTLNYLDEKGYYHEEFLKLPNEIKVNKTLILCDIVNKMNAASHFIGSNDGNLSAFVSLLRQGKNITDLRNEGLLIF